MGQQQEQEQLTIRAMFSRDFGQTWEWQTFHSTYRTLEAAVFKHSLTIGATAYNTETAEVLTGNVWGTREVSGIQLSVRDALGSGVPRYGGQMVDQVELHHGRVFRKSDGWNLELCHDGVHISRKASSVYRFGELDLFRHAGDYRETPEELSHALLRDGELRALELAVEAALAKATDCEDAPIITVEAE